MDQPSAGYGCDVSLNDQASFHQRVLVAGGALSAVTPVSSCTPDHCSSSIGCDGGRVDSARRTVTVSGFRKFQRQHRQFEPDSGTSPVDARPPYPLPLARASPAEGKPQVSLSGFRQFKRSKLPDTEACSSMVPFNSTPTSVNVQQAQPGAGGESAAGRLAQNGTLRVAGQKSKVVDQSLQEVTRSLALLTSPTKKKEKLSHALQPSQTQVVMHCDGTKTLGHGTQVSIADLKLVKQEQRNCQGLYSRAFFFSSSAPSQGSSYHLSDEERLSRVSLRRATRYVCLGTYGCRVGDCLSQCQDSDVLRVRQAFMSRRVSNSGKTVPLASVLADDLRRSWNRTTEEWEQLVVALDEVTSVKCCPSAYALLCGVAPTMFQSVCSQIKLATDVGSASVPSRPLSHAAAQVAAREQRSEDWCLLRSYVADLINAHEANPAPGAHQPGRITHINKSTWKSKWSAAEVYFKNAPRVPGSKSMLKKVWRLETRLKEKKACSHSKCNICSKIDVNMDNLRGVNTPAAVRDRANNQRAQIEHDKMHLGSRSELDDAGLKAFLNPRNIWTVLADAATQRNFTLPKFKFRMPKKLAGRPFWGYKLMATYAYGYGFTPFLVHDSQKFGANLTWTVLWKTLCAMREHYGYWPDVIHITLDNTKGENKNETLVCMCAWLVSSGKVKQVRVLFLMVGHTHIIIDHIFGVITVGLRRKELLVPEDLVQNIQASLAENPQYMAKPVEILWCLWDFKKWCEETMKPSPCERLFGGNVQDSEGSYSGMYDFVFTRPGTHQGLAVMKYREHPFHAWLPEASCGATTIQCLPSTPPEFQRIKSWNEWSMMDKKSVKDTISMCLEYARSVAELGQIFVRTTWQKHFDMIPESIDLLRPELKLVFQFFRDEQTGVLRIGAREGGQDATGPTDVHDADAEYEEWKRHNVDVRVQPLAIDPVVSSAQTKAEFERRKANMQEALRTDRGPTINQSSPIFLGDYVLATTTNGGVDLFSVATIENSANAFASNLRFFGVMYEHVPNGDVSGLFGTFRMKMTLTGEGTRRQQTRLLIRRDQVAVFNVEMHKKKKVLSIRSLRMLALALPDAYPFPPRRDIPETHLDSDEDDESAADKPRSANVRNRRRASAGKSASKPNKPAAAGPKRAVRNARKKADDSSEEDDDSEDESSSEDLSSTSDNDLERSDPSDKEGDEEEQQDAAEQSTEATCNVPDVPLDAVPPDAPLMLEGRTVEPVLESVLAFNMKDDPEYAEFAYPVALVFVRQVQPFEVAWFHLPETQLARRVGTTRKFKASNKFLTFHKFWSKANWWKGKKGERPTEEQIMDHWYTTTAHRNWIIPVDIPQPEATKVKQTDTFRLSMEFVTGTLIPACEAAHCVQ